MFPKNVGEKVVDDHALGHGAGWKWGFVEVHEVRMEQRRFGRDALRGVVDQHFLQNKEKENRKLLEMQQNQ